MSKIYDVAIIGGGPAGLSAAAGFARQLHTTVVFDSGSYRNERTSHMHVVPTWDHKDPKDFRAACRADLQARYSTTDFVDTKVTQVEKVDDSAFKVHDETGKTWTAKKLIIACGSEDIYPDIEGYTDCWARRIYHCLYCHGYEDRGAPSSGVLAVDFLANAGMVAHVSRMAAQLSKSVTIYTNGNDELSKTLQDSIGSPPFIIDNRKISKLHLEHTTSDSKGTSASDSDEYGGVTITFTDNTSKTEEFLVHAPKTKLKGPWAEQLGLKLTPMGDIETTPPFMQTSVPGVFAAGDCSTMMKVAVGAISGGAAASAGATAQLQAEKWGHKSMF